MRTYGLSLAVLCVWRLTHLLQAEDGPWDLVIREVLSLAVTDAIVEADSREIPSLEQVPQLRRV